MPFKPLLWLSVVVPFLIFPCLTVAAPNVGDPAPDFNLQGSDGKTYSLSADGGNGMVIAFFPKAFTGG